MKSDQASSLEHKGLSLMNIFTLALLIGGGVAASVFFLLHDRQNYQEVYNLQLFAGHSINISKFGSNDNPMPLYFIVGWAWVHLTAGYTSIFNNLDAARILSLLFYPLSVVAAYFVGLAATNNRRVAAAAAILLSLSPFMLWYSSRATMYSMLVFAVLINQYFFTRILDNPKRWHWLGYLITGLFGVGVHFFFCIILLVQLGFYLSKARRKLDILPLIICLALIGTAFAVWIHFSLAYSSFWHYLPYTSRPSATNTFIIFVQYLFGFQSVSVTTAIISCWPLLVIFALLAIQKYKAPSVGVQYSLIAATAPVLIMFSLSWIWKPLFLSSYLIVSLGPLMLLLGWYFVALNLSTLNLACYALMTLMIVTFVIQAANPSRAIQNDYLGSYSGTAYLSPRGG